MLHNKARKLLTERYKKAHNAQAITRADYTDVSDEVYRLREDKQNVQLENVGGMN